MKKTTYWISALITGLYTTFVAQCLWNWFAVPVLPVAPISFWQMLGFTLLIGFFKETDDSVEEDRWEKVYSFLEACLPASKKKDVEEFLNEKKETLWVDVGFKIVGKFCSNTLALVFGFLVYTIFLN